MFSQKLHQTVCENEKKNPYVQFLIQSYVVVLLKDVEKIQIYILMVIWDWQHFMHLHVIPKNQEKYLMQGLVPTVDRSMERILSCYF